MSTQANPVMRHLFEDWDAVAGRLQEAPVIALFLDFDGTLAPLRPRPDQVTLDGAARHVLTDLARSPRFLLWVISGRRRADVSARVSVPEIQYLGLHG
jgi:trehalose-phosphatase